MVSSLKAPQLLSHSLQDEAADIWGYFLSFPGHRSFEEGSPDYQDTYPQAAEIIRSSYVDDVLTGAPSEKAIHLRKQLNELLKSAGMTLRKWRCSSPTVLAAIPEDLREKEDLHLSAELHPGCKALGLHWNTP